MVKKYTSQSKSIDTKNVSNFKYDLNILKDEVSSERNDMVNEHITSKRSEIKEYSKDKRKEINEYIQVKESEIDKYSEEHDLRISTYQNLSVVELSKISDEQLRKNYQDKVKVKIRNERQKIQKVIDQERSKLEKVVNKEIEKLEWVVSIERKKLNEDIQKEIDYRNKKKSKKVETVSVRNTERESFVIKKNVWYWIRAFKENVKSKDTIKYKYEKMVFWAKEIVNKKNKSNESSRLYEIASQVIDVNIHNENDIKNNRTLSENIQSIYWFDEDHEITMDEYNEYVYYTSVTVYINEMNEEWLTAEEIKNRLWEDTEEINVDIINTIIKAIKDANDVSNILTDDVRLSFQLPWIESAYRAYTMHSNHKVTDSEKDNITSTKTSIILEDANNNRSAYYRYYNWFTFNEITTYASKSVEDQERDSSKQMKDNVIDKIRSHRINNQLHLKTKELYKKWFEEPILEFTKKSLPEDTYKIDSISYNTSHTYNISRHIDSWSQNNNREEKIEIIIEQSNGILNIDSIENIYRVWWKQYLLNSIPTKSPDKVDLLFQQQIFLKHVLKLLNIDKTTWMSQEQRNVFLIYTQLASKLNANQLKTSNKIISDPDSIIALQQSNISNISWETKQINVNLTWLAKQWITWLDNTSIQWIDDESLSSLTGNDVMTALQSFDDIIHAPDNWTSKSLDQKKIDDREFKKEYRLFEIENTWLYWIESAKDKEVGF